jgi:uncharacterized delta-60 repeat protein
MKRLRLFVLVAITAVVTACYPNPVDGSFGGKGAVTIDVGEQGRLGDAVVLPDGRIAVAGQWGSHTEASHISLQRLNTDGTLDPTFGQGGIVNTFVGGESGATVLARQDDDKLVVGGWSGPSRLSFKAAFTIMRYLPSGTLDAGFGDGGVVVRDLGGYDVIQAILIQPDGKIVVAGSGDHGLVVMRFSPNGSPDTGFGSGGVTVQPNAGRPPGPRTVVRQADDKLLLGLQGPRPGDPVGTRVFKVLRLTPTGSLDASFGENGVAMTDFGFGDSHDSNLVGLVLRSNGKILAAGSASDSEQHPLYAFARYDTNGVLDPSFGIGGRVLRAPPSGNPTVYGFAKQSGGYVVLSGIESSSSMALLARFTDDGDFDTTYGSGGVAATWVIKGARSLSSFPDGALLAVSSVGTRLARFLAPQR